MRKTIVLLGCTALAACGGGDGAGPTTIGGTAVTDPASVVPGPGGGVDFTTDTADTTSAPTSSTSGAVLNVTSATTYNALGGIQSLSVDETTGGQLYQGDAGTVQNQNGTIAYDPRDGIFTLTLSDTKAGVSTNYTYQDPAHRTDPTFAQSGTPNLAGFNYLQGIGSGSGNTTVTDHTTFFYQRPGESTTYVSLAGYDRNSVPGNGGTDTFERGAFVFGEPTTLSQVPTTGTGTYTGGMLATMVENSNYFQWIAGSSNVDVDFGKGTVGLTLNGVVGPATFNNAVVPDSLLSVPTGSTFTANGSASIMLTQSGGFTGQFSSASFTSGATTIPVDFSRPSTGNSVAGASSIDGTFYGPNAVNVGGSFRIVGGLPDQRVDILGAFTGAKH